MRIAAIVAELEAGEVSTAYVIASDLELDLEAAVLHVTMDGGGVVYYADGGVVAYRQEAA